MRTLRYSINVTLDGCIDHTVGMPDDESNRYWAQGLLAADALILGRVTYQMMEQAWRRPASGEWPEWMSGTDIEFAEAIDAAKKYVVSSTLDSVDWNSELLRGDIGDAVQELKEQPGDSLFVGGVTLPRELAELGLIDEYEFLMLPVVAGHGPALMGGLSSKVDLRLVGRREFASGAVALKYLPLY